MDEQPIVISSVGDMRSTSRRMRADGVRIALVPTMGALHEGHLALIRRAREEADAVVVSVFVNPTQFGPGEDYDLYPRTLDADRDLLVTEGGVAVLFVPRAGDMYPEGSDAQRIWIDTASMDTELCGRYRPGHFRGVATVVSKLFNVCLPHLAVFGLKDAQQFVIVRQMVSDLSLDVEIVGVETEREAGGLALSSRNRFLSPDERSQASVLSRAVSRAGDLIASGERDVAVVERAMQSELRKAPLARVQYASVVETTSLAPVKSIGPGQEILAATAVHFGTTRLIDSVFIRAPAE